MNNIKEYTKVPVYVKENGKKALTIGARWEYTRNASAWTEPPNAGIIRNCSQGVPL